MHSPAQTALPVLQTERSDILDILRGFALFGVLLDNVFGFSGWGSLIQADKESLPSWPVDRIISGLEQIFINGKFYSLFSLLFGIGFSIILIRNEQRGINPLKVFYRRLFVLLLFGAFHILFLWEGDILVLYVLIGFILPLFRKCSDRALLILAGVCIASPLLFDLFSVIFHYKNGAYLEYLALETDKRTGLPTDDSWRHYLYKDGSGWNEWRNWQASGYLYRYSGLLDSNRIPKVLGMFLLGFWAGRKMIYAQLENYVWLFKKLRFWGLIVGIPSAIACTYFGFFQKGIPNPVGLVHTLFYATSVVPLCLAYTSVICLYWVKKQKGSNKIGNESVREVKSRLRWLAPMGRMALTNYLMQTIVAITLYYGVGFGCGGNIGPVIFIPIGIGLYVLQILYSNLWFKNFNYGPFEWIWRMLTYGRILPLKRKQSSSTIKK